jgi:hypothetical protein
MKSNDHYNFVDSFYYKNLESIIKYCSDSKYSETLTLLDKFILKLSEFYNSQLLIIENRNYYTCQSLFRINIEHFLTVSFIWNRTIIEESNLCAEEYNLGYLAYEVFKQTNYNKMLDSNTEKGKTQLQKILETDIFKELNNPEDPLTEKNLVEINNIGNQFDVRNILKYYNNLPQNVSTIAYGIITLDACKRYNNLSSYVHGGRLADLEAYENTPIIDKTKVMNELLGLSKLFKSIVKDYKMIILYLEFESFEKLYKEVLDNREKHI